LNNGDPTNLLNVKNKDQGKKPFGSNIHELRLSDDAELHDPLRERYVSPS